MTVGERIAFFRKKIKVKQDEFAKSVGVSQSHISKIENNQDEPSDKLIQRILAVWGMDRNWLLYDEGDFLNEFELTPKTQCLSAINEYEQKYGEKTSEELFTMILEIIKICETLNYFKEDKTLEGVMNISTLFDEIQELLNFWVRTHKTINNNNYSAEEGKKIKNDVEDFNRIYYDHIIRALESLYSRISANMKCFRKYFDKILWDCSDDSTED